MTNRTCTCTRSATSGPRTAFPDWDDVADEQIANIRAELRGPDDDTRALADHLARVAGADFTDRWERRPVGSNRTGVRAFAHPEVGVLRMAFEILELSDPDRQRLVIYVPADSATAAGLDRLAGRRPGALRSVRTG